MTEEKLRPLSSETVRLIGSSQVITSVYSVVKELIENSFDAGSTTVEIKLEDFGLEKVEVRDNGTGISQSNIPLVGKRYHTSKISSFSDLNSLSTYGFRGEALGSLCAVCNLAVTSKTLSEDISYTFTFDHHGNVLGSQPSHLGQGTTISASKLFNNLPVRRQYYNTKKKKKEELKKIEDLLMTYGAIRPHIRLCLKNNKDVVWQKPVMADTKTALQSILGRNVFSQLEQRKVQSDDQNVTIEMFLPRPSSDVGVTSRAVGDRGMVAVNHRPVQLKDIDKCIRQHYCNQMKCEGRYPVFYCHVTLPTSDLDVNIDPNKTRVMLHGQKGIISLVSSKLEEFYGPICKASNDLVGKQASEDRDQQLNDSAFSSVSSDASLDNRSSRNVTHAMHCNETVDSSRTENTVCQDINTGFKISFYQKENDLTASIEDIPGKEKVESGQEKVTSDIGDGSESLSQVEKGDFDILDSDLSSILQTQSPENHLSSTSMPNEGGTKDAGKSHEELDNLDISAFLGSDFGSFCSEVVTKVDDDEQKENNFTEMKDMQGKTSEPVMKEMSSISIADWSRGVSEKRVDGQVLQPVQVLDGSHRKRQLSETEDGDMQVVTPPVKRKFDQPSLYEVMSKSPSQKMTVGFVAFSREMRPKVVEEHPDWSYDQITAAVKERWSRLSDWDKGQFCDSGSQQMQSLQKKVMEKRRLSQKIDHRIAPVKGLPSIKDQLLASSKGSASKNVPIATVKVAFSLAALKHTYQSGLRMSQTQVEKKLLLVGPLKFYSGWVCCHGNQLVMLNPHRVEETLLHRELMASHLIPATRLEEPLRLTEQNLGGQELYERLVELVPSDSTHTYMYIEDKRLISNGIKVRCHLNEHSKPVLDLVSMATCIPTYGVKDIQEVLDLIVNTGATTLYQARPVKVIYYLQGEAVRMVRQRPLQRNRVDMEDLLEQIDDSLPADCVKCLHNKPFLHDVWDLEKLDQSESSDMTVT